MAWANPAAPNLPDFLLFVQNDMQIPATALPIVVAAPGAPSLTAATTGGALPTGTVYVRLTYVSLYGETTASPEASISVTGPTGQVAVASPAAATGAQSYNVYAADASGAEVLQNTTPVAIGAAYQIDALATGTAAPPTTNTAGSPWPEYAFNRAMTLVMAGVIYGLDYTLAVYNCAGHILIGTAPDQPGQTYFAQARDNFDLLDSSSGVISGSSDQGTSNSFSVPPALQNMTMGDLWFFKTPWGRAYLSFGQSFGEIAGLS